MCGIFGFVGEKTKSYSECLDIIQHRGPDSEGFLAYTVDDNEISRGQQANNLKGTEVAYFGFRRLAIIDKTSKANQPFSSEDQDFHIIFNGEIYNYLELRSELANEGISFRTNSDTEVLLKSYIRWGPACLNKLNGMWSFAILDRRNKKIFCSRDRFGIKPFYYAFDKFDNFVFGSEIKQLIKAGVDKNINENVIRDYLEKGIVDHSEQTFYKGVNALKGGHYLELELKAKSHRPEIKRYYTLERKNDSQKPFESLKKEFSELFTDSLRLRFRSDVEVGSCLSGGLDSSSIVSVASKSLDASLQTFTASFGLKEFDESSFVREIADNYKSVKAHFCYPDAKNFEQAFDKILWHQDEPFISMSIYSQWEVMKLANSNGLKVLLDGQGGDELLGGYRKYYVFFLRELLKRFRIIRFIRELIHGLLASELKLIDRAGISRYLNISKNSNLFTVRFNLLKPASKIGLGSAATFERRMLLDIENFSYPPLLRYEDRNSMAYSIESRIPFMDYRLVEFLFSLKADYKIRGGYTKYILRESLKNILPRSIYKRKSKLGFSVPQKEWMTKELRLHFLEYFEKINNPYINTRQLLVDFKKFSQKSTDTGIFFRIYCFSKWYDTVTEGQ